MSEKIRAHIFVSGTVQGVFFRHNTQQKANELEITGWIKNLPNGQVEAVFEGEKERVQRLIEWLQRGPDLARVDGLDVELEEYRGEFGSFEVRH